jgi:hypothetical protein
MNVKAAEFQSFPAIIPHSITIQMSLGFFIAKFSKEMKPANFALTFILLIFRYKILYAKYVDLLDKLKEVEKSQFFSTVQECGLF